MKRGILPTENYMAVAPKGSAVSSAQAEKMATKGVDLRTETAFTPGGTEDL